MIEGFFLPWLSPARPARAKTRARLLWDREYLYFLAQMEGLPAPPSPGVDPSREEGFSLFLKPEANRPAYFEFITDPAGQRRSLAQAGSGSGDPGKSENGPELPFEAMVHLGNRSHDWTVEGRISWRAFLRAGGRPDPGDCWAFALCRTAGPASGEGVERSTCAPLAQPDFHRTGDYAQLRFVGPSEQPSAPYGLDHRIALLTSRVIGSPDPPLPFRVVPAFPKLKIPCPIAVAREPGTDSLLLAHQLWPWGGAGKILRVRDDPETNVAEELLSLDAIAYGVAFHPDYLKNGYLFVGNNGPMAPGHRKTRVSRYTVSRTAPYRIEPGSETTILEWDSDGHNGGDLTFGSDGMLYVTSGDGSSDSDAHRSGQDLSRLLAKVLRIDVDHPSPGMAYSVPPDNPFVGLAGARPETWAYGLRNPWRITCDRATGDLWVGQNGQDLWEQVYLIHRGENYGWSVMEGGHPFYPDRKAGPTPFTKPLVDHPHSEFRSLTGGFVYRGDAFPELRGAYLYGDWSTGRIWGVKENQRKITWHRELAKTSLQITGFGEGSRGDILICDHGGRALFRLERTPADEVLPPFPTRLSETGLFSSVAGHRVAPALIPYSVNAQLWSDGAYKERYLALPGSQSHIDFTVARGWNFPDLTVIVKSFALDLVEGDPRSRRWIETRLLTRQGGQWAGYSYLWNDQQTEATLVEASGTHREFSIREATGTRLQTWHYPSRAECMMCHSRAANFVLGLSTVQMNKTHDYPGAPDNQLRTLEHLGLFRVDWRSEAVQALREEARGRGLSGPELDAEVRRRSDPPLPREPRFSPLLALPPEKYGRLANPYDPAQALDARARSYLHANCAICHVESGGGNAALELETSTPQARMNLVGLPPLHDSFGIPGAKLLDPGHPERSILLERMGRRGTGQMPPLATARVDVQAVQMLRDWVTGLSPSPEVTSPRR
jgi:glucose/arabinose dehydrogenase